MSACISFQVTTKLFFSFSLEMVEYQVKMKRECCNKVHEHHRTFNFVFMCVEKF